MSDSPVSATPYEVLGVPASASDEELKQAYRRQLRLTHPDTGGSQASFIAVQLAWERVGTPESRASYDRSRGTGGASRAHWAPRSAPERPDTRPKARTHGHPGGWRRERYLTLMREWAGRGVELDDPYDPALVTTAPRELRRILADALAEEASARILADLGIGFTVWHDVATFSSEEKIDHVVLGPTGLFALLSEDYGGPVAAKRGELISASRTDDVLGGYQPVHELGARAKALSREARVKFSALVIVLPDDELSEPYVDLGKQRGAAVIAVRRSYLAPLVRDGVPGGPSVGGTDLFELRTRLQQRVRFA